MIKDTANGLEFTYNSLNLLQNIKQNGIVKVTYTYLADGTRLAMRTEGGTEGHNYLGRFLYAVTGNETSLAFASTTDGFLTDEGMVYALTDHLGSVRVLVDDEGEVLERNDYYPFGTRHPNSSYPTTDNNRLFAGMERQPLIGGSTYDFGARQLNGKLGRWMSADPKAEKYYSQSPYGYCGNNPINNIDWLGMDYWSTNDPGQIGAFLDALKGGYLGSHDYWGWTYMSDNDFASSLSFNDSNNTYYWSESQIINGELTIIGRHLKKFGYNWGNAIVGTTLFGAEKFADMMKISNATYQLTDSEGYFDFKYFSDGRKVNQDLKTNNVAKVGRVLKPMVNTINGYLIYNSIKNAIAAYDKGASEALINHSIDAVIGLIGYIPPYGSYISVSWSVFGKELFNLQTYKIKLNLKNGINPGLPAYQPFK